MLSAHQGSRGGRVHLYSDNITSLLQSPNAHLVLSVVVAVLSLHSTVVVVVVVTEVMILHSALEPALAHCSHHPAGGRAQGRRSRDSTGGDLSRGGADPVIQGGEGLVLDPDISFLGRRRG